MTDMEFEAMLCNTAQQIPAPQIDLELPEGNRGYLLGRRMAAIACVIALAISLVGGAVLAASIRETKGTSTGWASVLLTQLKYGIRFPEQIAIYDRYKARSMTVNYADASEWDKLLGDYAYRCHSVSYDCVIEQYMYTNDEGQVTTHSVVDGISVTVGSTRDKDWAAYFGYDPNTLEKILPEGHFLVEMEEYLDYHLNYRSYEGERGTMYAVSWVDEERDLVFSLSSHEDLGVLKALVKEFIDVNY